MAKKRVGCYSVAEWIHIYTFGDSITHYITESLNFLRLMNSATKGPLRDSERDPLAVPFRGTIRALLRLGSGSAFDFGFFLGLSGLGGFWGV